ncbi:MAG TPA: hypothetical protein PKA00_03470 [Saprospiraceae bacterium]|nr:hypothetical protein [Saprospiraceae bacterium]HMQ81936.1 hypothetical protein [Saprospiraceae bacterium]
MNNWQTLSILMLLVSIFLTCERPLAEIPDETVGMAPVYYEGDWQTIQVLGAQPISRLHKIYYKDGYIFAGETSKGIHIIDNQDPTNPQKIKFIQIIGNSDIAIKGSLLYANNLNDLVVLDISDLEHISVRHRLENAFPQGTLITPPNYNGFFECPDPAMGQIQGWVEQTIQKPQCWQ